MLDLLTQTTSVAILVSAVVFYVLGRFQGFKTGAILSAEITVDTLLQQGYLRYRITDDGEKQIIKLKE